MSIFAGDASEIYKLASDLAAVGPKSVPAVRQGMEKAGRDFAFAWASDAARTHDSHAKYYSGSIDFELIPSVSSVAVDVGPNRGRKQGFLGRILEFGGERSPAYMTGAKALERQEGPAERAIANALDPLFP